MTNTLLLALADAGAPSITAPPYLAEKVLRQRHRRQLHRRVGVVVVAGGLAVGGTVAARAGHSDYFAQYQPSGSMQPTLGIGESLLADRRLTPARGDLVVVHLTEDGLTGDFTKRVVGLPGDEIGCPAGDDGTCHGWVRNGQVLDEPYTEGNGGDVVRQTTVASGDLFLLGDHRDDSVDSRSWSTPVRLSDVLGVGVAIAAPSGQRRPVPGAPRHPGPSGHNVDPGQQPTAGVADAG